jgi:hypothetical protein
MLRNLPILPAPRASACEVAITGSNTAHVRLVSECVLPRRAEVVYPDGLLVL